MRCGLGELLLQRVGPDVALIVGCFATAGLNSSMQFNDQMDGREQVVMRYSKNARLMAPDKQHASCKSGTGSSIASLVRSLSIFLFRFLNNFLVFGKRKTLVFISCGRCFFFFVCLTPFFFSFFFLMSLLIYTFHFVKVIRYHRYGLLHFVGNYCGKKGELHH